MKKTFILILLTIFLSGCGIFNLNSFIMPNDIEFLSCILELDNPQKIAKYMEENFKYKERLYNSLSPYQFYIIKEGDCNDFSTFGIFVATHNGIESYQIKIIFIDSIHFLGVYKENYYTFTDNWIYYREYLTFRDIVIVNSFYQQKDWLRYIVYDYNNNVVEKGFNNQ